MKSFLGQPGGGTLQLRSLMPQKMPLGAGRERMVVRAPGSSAVIGSMVLQNTGREIYLSDLQVQPTHRLLGIGSRLVSEAVQCARVQHVEALRLEARPADSSISAPALVQMYHKLGFRNNGVSAKGSPVMQCILSGGSQLPMHRNPTAQTMGQVQMKVQPGLHRVHVPAITPLTAFRLYPRARLASIQRKPTFPAAVPAPHLRGVVQRAHGFTPLVLSDMADHINQARTGLAESRNTQALTRSTSGTFMLFTQREYSAFDDAIMELENQHTIALDDRVIGDNRNEDEGIHSEMLAISQWLTGAISRPSLMGVSQPVCGRCAAVLDIFGIGYCPVGGQMTRNWVHPIRHAFGNFAQVPHGVLTATQVRDLRNLPQKVTNNRERNW
jgi:GNAT superfamily N-acetyltransferase